MHPLLNVFSAAARGSFPPADGGVTYLPPLDEGLEAVVSMTGHAYVASRLGERELEDLAPDGFGAVLHPDVLIRIAGLTGRIGVTDVTMFAVGRGGGTLPIRHDLDDHPRVRYARELRQDVKVHGDPDGLVTIGLGLAGRLEMSIETSGNGSSRGRDLIGQALGLVPPGGHLFAAVSPGNSRSLRAFLGCGFVPIGSEVIIRPAPEPG